MKCKLFLLLNLCFATSVTIAQIDHWESVVRADNEWHYFVGNTAPPGTWNQLNFNDSSWPVGEGSIGYGDNDDQTIIEETLTLFIRRRFEIVDLNNISSAVLHADFDDGFVAYLNGVEFARSNVEGFPPAHDTPATDFHEAGLYLGIHPEEFVIDQRQLKDLLQEGSNVLAVQIHNYTYTSSDLTAAFFLSLAIQAPSTDYQPTPSWFQEPGFLSNLPIIKIYTNGQEIVDEPDIVAGMGIIYNGEGNQNHILDPFNDYDGQVNIEIRGESSQSFPKKSYAVETIDENGEDEDVSILGFPEEEDWVLHGPYSDKTLMRNVLTMHLGRRMGQYASRTRFCELFIDGDYRGIYVLMERIKRDGDRVDVNKLNPDEVSGDDLTGGYIFRIDKGPAHWFSNFDVINTTDLKIAYQYVYPKIEDIVPEQEAYIQAYVDSFENAIASQDYHFGGKRYNDFIDLNSFAENFLLNELSRNVDGYRLSSYFHKKKDSNGGKIFAGPLWDFNLAWFNADYCFGDSTAGWFYEIYCHNGNPFWWQNMFADTTFTNLSNCRWNELRQGPFHRDSLLEFIDDQVAFMGDAIAREFNRWDRLNFYVWPNPVVSGSFEGEISNMKNWILERLAWMDANMMGTCENTSTSTAEIPIPPRVIISPNPTTGKVEINLSIASLSNIQLSVFNATGQKIAQQTQAILPDQENRFDLDLKAHPPGLYFISLNLEGYQITKRLLKI